MTYFRKSKTIYRNGNSRSYRAECAENEGRFPISKCAAFFNMSLKLFKEALNYAKIESNEWHHVSKFANKVNFYDTNEIKSNFSFWFFIKNRSKKNKDVANSYMKLIAKDTVLEKLNDMSLAKIAKKPKFVTDIKRRCEEFKIPFNVLFDALPSGSGTVTVRNGYRLQDDIRFNRFGGSYCVGTSYVSVCKHVKPFDLTKINIRDIIKNKPKFPKTYNYYNINYKPFLNIRQLKLGIENMKKGLHFNTNNSFSGESERNHIAKNKLIHSFNTRMLLKNKEL